MVDILIAKKYTKFDHVKRVEALGRKRGKPIGSYILDLADLRKAIVLCRHCVSGFEPKKHHYVQHRTVPFVQGNCDACRNFDQRAAMFVHESINY